MEEIILQYRVFIERIRGIFNDFILEHIKKQTNKSMSYEEKINLLVDSLITISEKIQIDGELRQNKDLNNILTNIWLLNKEKKNFYNKKDRTTQEVDDYVSSMKNKLKFIYEAVGLRDFENDFKEHSPLFKKA